MRIKIKHDKDSERKPVPGIFNKCLYYFIVIVLVFIVSFMMNTDRIYYMTRVNGTMSVKELDKVLSDKNVANILSSLPEPKPDLKYILLWTSDEATPFIYFGKGRSVFIEKNCSWTNCYVTSDRNYLSHYTEFDVIAFNGPQLSKVSIYQDVPNKRNVRQKYVYANIEAVSNYPFINTQWNDFFNWTWTYRLDSDALWGYMAIRNATNHVIGPSTNMHWMDVRDMDPIDDKLREKLKSKSKAAAWFSSNCNTMSQREVIVERIRKELRKYNLDVDVYGACGKHHCPREIMDRCMKSLQKHYYFYFAFENALSEDYVTEKIVYALQHDTVPVVFGGANYTRFMPHGIYLDVMKLGPELLAKKISVLMQNPEHYYEFFKWKKYYSYHFRNEDPATDDYCNFCEMMNDENLTNKTTVQHDIKSWWSNKVSYGNYTEINTMIVSGRTTVHRLISLISH